MKNLFILIFALISFGIIAQPVGYYQSAQGLTGNALKAELHNIIDGHQQYNYSTVKQILKSSDEDTANSNNILLFYTGWSIDKSDFSSNNQVDFWNREHVWAKSHGDFGTDPGPGTDCHAIRPVDASVNSARSYFDFDNGGTEYIDGNGLATGCYLLNGVSWEPRDEVKGDVARQIFYMATRYEGTNGEIDLEVVDQVNTFPFPEHGKLSTLLQWNIQDPPDDFERNRNEVVYNWQGNRNPFVDYPEFAYIIWSGASANPIEFSNVNLNPAQATANDPVALSLDINHTASAPFTDVSIFYGTDWFNLSAPAAMTNTSGNEYTFSIPGHAAQTRVYFMILVYAGSDINYYSAYYDVASGPFTGTLTSIYDVQGQTSLSPMEGQTVSISGVVTAAFGADFFLQEGSGPWSGVFVYNSGYFPAMGDSIIITGEVDEYYDKTEIKNVSDYYFISSNNIMPEPIVVATGSMQDEQYEGVLVKLQNAECVRDTNYGMWIVNDGSGDALIHNSSVYTHAYVIGDVYDITGPLNYDFDEFKLELRGSFDVTGSEDLTAPEWIQIDATTSTIINVIFNEALYDSSAVELSNYSINNSIVVEDARLHAFDKTRLILTVSELTAGSYTLTIDGLEDLAGNAISNMNIDFVFSTGINEINSNMISIYPNPVKDLVNVSCNTSENQISVINELGKVIYAESFNSRSFSFDVKEYHKGIYYLRIQNANGSFIRKLIKH